MSYGEPPTVMLQLKPLLPLLPNQEPRGASPEVSPTMSQAAGSESEARVEMTPPQSTKKSGMSKIGGMRTPGGMDGMSGMVGMVLSKNGVSRMTESLAGKKTNSSTRS